MWVLSAAADTRELRITDGSVVAPAQGAPDATVSERERAASGLCAACVVKPTDIDGTSGGPRRGGGVANGAGGANTHQIRVT